MSEKDRIEARRRDWIAAFNARDIEAMTDFVQDDHIAMPPNRPARQGLSEVKDFWEEGYAAAQTSMSIRSRSLLVSGDLAVDQFDWEMRIEPHGGDGAMKDTGGCVWIWRRGSDGEWRTSLSIWNSALPEPGPWPGGRAS